MINTAKSSSHFSGTRKDRWSLLSRLGAFGAADIKGKTSPVIELLPLCPNPSEEIRSSFKTGHLLPATPRAQLTALYFTLHDLADLARMSEVRAVLADLPFPTKPGHVWVNLKSRPLSLASAFPSWDLKGGFGRALQLATIWPRDRARMWLGTEPDRDHGGQDLLRLYRIIAGHGAVLTEAEIYQLPPHLRRRFLSEGDLLTEAAVIPDNRNEQSLFLSQFHARLVAYHNHMVDRLEGIKLRQENRHAVYDAARRQVNHTFQSALIHDVLPDICDQNILEWSLRHAAPVYRRGLKNWATGTAVPVETIVLLTALLGSSAPLDPEIASRSGEEWSSGIEGKRKPGRAIPTLPRSLFQSITVPTRLHPDNLIDWSRFLNPPEICPAQRNRQGSEIDPVVHDREPLRSELQIWMQPDVVFRFLSHEFGIKLDQVDMSAIRNVDGSHMGVFPLDLYLLSEAVQIGERLRLGPLASLILSETIIGLADVELLELPETNRARLSDILLSPDQFPTR